MLVLAHNILLGHAKPGSRIDSDFYGFCFSRFEGLLDIATSNGAKLLLTGKSFGFMKLHQWLDIISLLQRNNITPVVHCLKRPSDDLIALHKSGRLQLITDGSAGEMSPGVKFSVQGATIYFAGPKRKGIAVDIQSGLISSPSQEVALANAVQVDKKSPSIMLIDVLGHDISSVGFDSAKCEQDLVLLDYAETIQGEGGTALFDSSFSKRLLDAINTTAETLSIQMIINQLDCDDKTKSYLHYLERKAIEEVY